MRVYCDRYPELEIQDIGVRFRSAEADVPNELVPILEAMRGFGFVFVEEGAERPASAEPSELAILNKMLEPELIAYAKQHDIKLPRGGDKTKMREAIRAALE